MPMIPCTTGCLALYAQEDGSTLAVPVEAWSFDDENAPTPFVAGTTHLAAAHSLPGFQRLEQAALIVPAAQPVRQPTPVRRPGPKPGPGDEREPRDREVKVR